MTSLTAALLSVAAGTLLGNAYWPLGVPPSDALNARLKADNEL
nr:hypothetical protein [Asticcacaulis sp. AND118]